MITRSISLPDELDARLRALSREDLPSLSALVARLLDKELKRREKAVEKAA